MFSNEKQFKRNACAKDMSFSVGAMAQS